MSTQPQQVLTFISHETGDHKLKIVSIDGDKLEVKAELGFQSSVLNYKMIGDNIIIFQIGKFFENSYLVFYDLKEKKIIAEWKHLPIESFILSFPYLCTRSFGKEYLDLWRIWNIEDITKPVQMIEFPSLSAVESDFLFFSLPVTKPEDKENSDRIITFYPSELYIINPKTKEVKKICNVRRVNVKNMLVWNDYVVICHRTGDSYQHLSFYPLAPLVATELASRPERAELKSEEKTKEIITELPIYGMELTKTGELVLICRDADDHGHVDILTKEFKFVRLVRQSIFSYYISGNLLAIVANTWDPSIRIYDIDALMSQKELTEKKKVLLKEITLDCTIKKLIGDKVIVRTFRGIHVLSLTDDSAKFYEFAPSLTFLHSTEAVKAVV
jgi:hypothetical protein